MQFYLVGGAVRDKLLGLPVKEKDWVVVGATPEEMIELGYQPVGKEFPVFLHPETHEEYALARTERKTGKGYKGFIFHATPDVKLVEDLKRRDLTINAMAESPDGELIDPYHGQEDLKNKIFRHVSSAFQEDPVRILRLARFSARFPDFTVHPDTKKLIHTMSTTGEINALVPERVWQELSKALKEPKPINFFKILSKSHALSILFPEINMQSNGIKALTRATEISHSNPIRFAALLHDIPEKGIRRLVRHYRIPNEYSDLALVLARHGDVYRKILNLNAESLLSFILATDVLRRPNRFNDFLTAAKASYTDITQNHEEFVSKAVEVIKSVDITPLQEKNLKGEDFATELKRLRLNALRNFRG